MSLVERSVTSASWNAGANLFKVAILLARSILLARLLPIETFGVYALATAVVTFSGILPKFGLGGAFLHRAAETADEESAAAVHFTLRLVLTAIWAVALLSLSLLLADGGLRLALVVLTLLYGGLYLTDTARMVLVRRVQHRRLAVLDLLNAIATTIVAVILARRGYQLTALLATDFITLAVTVVVLLLWRPVWRPRLLWLRQVVGYYLSFGRRTMAESALSEALDNLDDIWTGVYLGDQALGLYSRAFTFATYPRRLLAFPVFEVAGGTYAELKDDAHQLAQAFFRVNALLLRSGFLMGGLLVLIAPEFVRLLLGEKWLPMVTAFQLMFVYTLLDPVRVTVGQLFVAVGRPERLWRTRLVQLAILVVGLFTLGQRWGINGVAIVVNVMLMAGLVWLLHRAREFVRFSAARLFVPPAVALAGGVLAALAAVYLGCGRTADLTCESDWLAMALKGAPFVATYGGLLFLMERREMSRMAHIVRRALFPRPGSPS
ncbi:membrane protein of unknown function [Candidatus Promineifilum breve]|uniref:Polysaccharide biosynthesis protein C-terminal domain-containing protein n=1 Tax=Candidatus Promineifilum breve TaxID=1806508 RepID=A0A160SY61_9CHLR|nr:oligosaccharide flippase family protein [Candidatus Promineifilum breve]CUS01964.2 membrane protein of unknown function [Candidatus Promineifilum breve]